MKLKTKIIYYFVILILFTSIYYLFESESIEFINEDKDDTNTTTLLDCLHFSIITQTTVGYGHMYPTTTRSKLIVDIHCLLTAFLLFA